MQIRVRRNIRFEVNIIENEADIICFEAKISCFIRLFCIVVNKQILHAK